MSEFLRRQAQMVRKLIVTTFIGLSALTLACSESKPPFSPEALPGVESLEDLRWRNRILLVREPEAKQAMKLSATTEQSAALADRELLVFVEFTAKQWRLSDASILSSQLSKDISTCIARFDARDDTRVFLLGKDGGLKGRYTTLDLEAIYAEIDRMPMRREEMREKGR